MIRTIALALLLAGPAAAESQCGQLEQFAEQLYTQYGELPQFFGLDNRGYMTFMYLNTETGSWTVLMMQAGGLACVAAAGEAGQVADKPAGGVEG